MKPRDWIEVALLATFFCLALAGLAAPLIGPTNPRSTLDLWLSLLSTSGTVAAVVAALYIASESRRKESELADEKASMVAAKIVVRVQATKRDLSISATQIRQYESSYAIQCTFFDVFLQTLDGTSLEFDDADLMALIPIEGRVAHRLRFAVERLRVLRADVVTALDRCGWSQVSGGPRIYKTIDPATVLRWRDELLDCYEVLIFVQRVLEDIALSGAPPIQAKEYL